MRTTFIVACLAMAGLALGQADAWAQRRGGNRGGGGGNAPAMRSGGQGGAMRAAPSPGGGGTGERAAPSARSAAPRVQQPSARVEGAARAGAQAGARESFYRGDAGARIESSDRARLRTDGAARVEGSRRSVEGQSRLGAEARTEADARLDAAGRTRVEGDSQLSADARLRDGDRARIGDSDRIVDRDRYWNRYGSWDRYGRRMVRFWSPNYGWTWGYGPRWGYWDGLGWGYGPWSAYGYGSGWYGDYYGGPYAYGSYGYSQPYAMAPAPRTGLGVFMDERDNAVFVRSVVPNSPAEQAGLRPGDMIIAINGNLVTSADQVRQIVAEHNPGDELEIETDRNGREVRTAAVLEEHGRVF